MDMHSPIQLVVLTALIGAQQHSSTAALSLLSAAPLLKVRASERIELQHHFQCENTREDTLSDLTLGLWKPAKFHKEFAGKLIQYL